LTINTNRDATGRNHSQSFPLFQFPRHLLGRLFLFAGFLVPDILLLASTPHPFSLLGALAPFGIVSYAVFVGLGYSHFKKQKQILPFSVGFFTTHLGCILVVSLINAFALHGFDFLLFSQSAHLVSRIVLLVGIALLALACIPLQTWISTIRETKRLWLYSVITGALAWCLRFPFQSFWDSSSTAPGRALQILTFHSVKVVLRFFLPGIYVNQDTFIIGTQRFSVFIAEACSGLEGLGLVLAFTVIWLWYFRKESRFPQALLLVPCALACVWVLNILRISALVLIGNAGYGEIAMVGFHSQAGWIAFTTVAFGFSMATRKLPWVRKVQYYYALPAEIGSPSITSKIASNAIVPSASGAAAIHPSALEAEPEATGESPATAAYLVPFLAILAASFFSKAASGYFEWLYPLRFLVAAIAIWRYWPELKRIDWRLDLRGWVVASLAGAGVFLIGLAPTFWSHPPETSPLGAALAALSPTARWAWIAFRVAAAVLTVPIAEELAFRGYLARRLVNREFDSIPFSAVTALAVALSSVAFGFMYGRQWIAGILAGLIYAGLVKWKGRLADAIAAHATANLLLAIWILSRSDWSQW
jgi:CAAX prenyl protease-like protein